MPRVRDRHAANGGRAAALISYDDDLEPETHALRLALTLAWRACPDISSPWSVPEQLSLYLSKISHIPASCQLSAKDELTLLRAYGQTSDPTTRARMSFLDAAHDATLASNRPLNSPRPILGQVAPPRLSSRQHTHHARPQTIRRGAESASLLLQPEALAVTSG